MRAVRGLLTLATSSVRPCSVAAIPRVSSSFVRIQVGCGQHPSFSVVKKPQNGGPAEISGPGAWAAGVFTGAPSQLWAHRLPRCRKVSPYRQRPGVQAVAQLQLSSPKQTIEPYLVPGTGIEPVRPCWGPRILSPLRLPISPPGLSGQSPSRAGQHQWRDRSMKAPSNLKLVLHPLDAGRVFRPAR
jgi:hypothetical protein